LNVSRKNLGKQIMEESRRIRSSGEWKIHAAIQELDFAFRVHARNYAHLKAWTKKTEIRGDDDERIPHLMQLWSEDNPDRLEAVLEEANRHLHNFLASASTLVDHTRNHVRRLYSGLPFERECQAKIDEDLAQTPVCRFVQCLRNHNLHYQFPFTTANLSMDFDEPGQVKTVTTGMALSVSSLLRWDGWDDPANRYLTDADDELTIEKLADDYMGIITQFHDWRRSRELNIHHTELTYLQQRIDRLRALESYLFGESPAS